MTFAGCAVEKNRIPAGLLALIFLLTNSGCSFVFMKAPPENYAAGEEIECRESIGAPVADTILAVVAGIMSLSLFVSSSTHDPDDWLDFSEIEQGVAGIILVPMFVHGTSAIYGYVSANKCKRAKTGHEVVRIPSAFGIAAQEAD